MLRRMILGGFVVVALLGAPSSGHAGVNVNIGINLPAPPQLVAVPASPVFYAPALPANYFSYAGQYYVFANSVWHVGPRHNGPWAVVAPEYIPVPILTGPVVYYRVPPPEWKHRRREAPPRWAPAWGRRWEEDRGGHREGNREEQREERREDRREGHRDERR